MPVGLSLARRAGNGSSRQAAFKAPPYLGDRLPRYIIVLRKRPEISNRFPGNNLDYKLMVMNKLNQIRDASRQYR